MTYVMTKRKTIVGQKKKRMGRPVTVRGEQRVSLRLPTELLDAVDKWAKANKASRSDAFRHLLGRALKAEAGD